MAVAVGLVAFGSASCTKGQTAAWFAARELGSSERDPKPYMRTSMDHPNPGVAQTTTGFWCDEFAAEMLRRAGIAVPDDEHEPGDLADVYPLASPPWRPGDLVFVSYDSSRPQQVWDHVGILLRADGDHLWVVDGNWSNGERWPSGKTVSGVVLNERWVGDGSVSEIRRP